MSHTANLTVELGMPKKDFKTLLTSSAVHFCIPNSLCCAIRLYCIYIPTTICCNRAYLYQQLLAPHQSALGMQKSTALFKSFWAFLIPLLFFKTFLLYLSAFFFTYKWYGYTFVCMLSTQFGEGKAFCIWGSKSTTSLFSSIFNTFSNNSVSKELIDSTNFSR